MSYLYCNNNNNNNNNEAQKAQKEYKRQHDNVAKKVHWDICKKNRLDRTQSKVV